MLPPGMGQLQQGLGGMMMPGGDPMASLTPEQKQQFMQMQLKMGFPGMPGMPGMSQPQQPPKKDDEKK